MTKSRSSAGDEKPFAAPTQKRKGLFSKKSPPTDVSHEKEKGDDKRGDTTTEVKSDVPEAPPISFSQLFQ
jgi:hypothetical protein